MIGKRLRKNKKADIEEDLLDFVNDFIYLLTVQEEKIHARLGGEALSIFESYADDIEEKMGLSYAYVIVAIPKFA